RELRAQPEPDLPLAWKHALPLLLWQRARAYLRPARPLHALSGGGGACHLSGSLLAAFPWRRQCPGSRSLGCCHGDRRPLHSLLSPAPHLLPLLHSAAGLAPLHGLRPSRPRRALQPLADRRRQPRTLDRSQPRISLLVPRLALGAAPGAPLRQKLPE